MITNEIPDGYYVLIYTWQRAQISNWGLSSYDISGMFNSLGGTSVAGLGIEVPFIFFTKKGDLSSTREVVGLTSRDVINFSTFLKSSDNLGEQESLVIGPSQSWNKFESDYKETPQNDSIAIRLVGVKEDAAEQDVYLNYSYKFSDNSLPFSQNDYPRIRFKGLYSDRIDYIPFQQKSWLLSGDHQPELTIAPNIHYYLSNDTIEQGENISLSVAIKNISKYDFDSLKVNYWIEDLNGDTYPLEYPRQDSLKSGEVLIDTVTFRTDFIAGLASLWVEANPIVIHPYGYDQPEMHHFNNLLQVPVYVKGDNQNPLLDVTFDGVHILDGDIVSAKPEVIITLDDDSQFLLMDEMEDTTNFKVFLTSPDKIQQQIYFVSNDNYEMEFIPASSSKNRSQVIYTPKLSIDGTYNLIVQATDKSGNRSSSIDYKISFEVINKSSITNVFNYPNPFSTSTHFVFTLTGSQIPDNMFIQIMTISGKVVKEIYMDELGLIHVGHNKTEYTWDGTDMYGDRLANGVYLYRVVTKINDTEIEQRSTSADYMFKKGWGKMVLLR